MEYVIREECTLDYFDKIQSDIPTKYKVPALFITVPRSTFVSYWRILDGGQKFEIRFSREIHDFDFGLEISGFKNFLVQFG